MRPFELDPFVHERKLADLLVQDLNLSELPLSQ